MLLILILIGAINPAFAKFTSAYECESILIQAEVKQPKETPAFDRTLYIGKEEMAEVEKLVRVDQLTHAELLKRAFEIYVQARIRNVPTLKKSKVYEALSHITTRVVVSALGPSDGTYWSDDNEIGIASKVPRDSVVYYRYLAHEMEHALQKFGAIDELTWMVKNWSKLKKYGEAKDDWWPWYSYHKELEAIRAEYDFLRLLPDQAMLGDRHGDYDQTETNWVYARTGDFKRFHDLSSYSSIYAVKRNYYRP